MMAMPPLPPSAIIEKLGGNYALDVVVRTRITGKQGLSGLGRLIGHRKDRNSGIMGKLQRRNDRVTVERGDEQYIHFAVH